MTIQECYLAIGGDFAGVMQRLGKEERVEKFLLMLLKDTTYEDLCAALEQDQATEAFRAAHSLKGISLNLGLTELVEAASNLTEALRGNQITEEAGRLFPILEEKYVSNIEAIRSYAAERKATS